MPPIRRSFLGEPGSSTFAARRQLPAPAGSVAAAWQAAAKGMQFLPFTLGSTRYSLFYINSVTWLLGTFARNLPFALQRENLLLVVPRLSKVPLHPLELSHR